MQQRNGGVKRDAPSLADSGIAAIFMLFELVLELIAVINAVIQTLLNPGGRR